MTTNQLDLTTLRKADAMWDGTLSTKFDIWRQDRRLLLAEVDRLAAENAALRWRWSYDRTTEPG